MNLTKYFMTSMKEDDSVGPTDFPSIWNLGIRSGKDKAGKQMLLNWTGDTPAVRSVLIDSALGPRGAAAAVVSAAHGGPRSVSEQPAAAGLAFYTRRTRSIRSSPRQDKKSTHVTAPPVMSRAANLPAKSSRSRRSGRIPERTHSWSKAAAEEANRKVKETRHRSPADDGAAILTATSRRRSTAFGCARPILHNGSVPLCATCSIRLTNGRRPSIAATMFTIR